LFRSAGQSAANSQKLSKKYHPDLNPDEAAHEKFIEVAKGKIIQNNFSVNSKLMNSIRGLIRTRGTYSQQMLIRGANERQERYTIDTEKKVSNNMKLENKEVVMIHSQDSLEEVDNSKNKEDQGC
jgi:hypothetical protein